MIEKEAKYELKLELKKYLNQKTNYSMNNLELKLKLSSKDDLFVLICDLFKDTINDFNFETPVYYNKYLFKCVDYLNKNVGKNAHILTGFDWGGYLEYYGYKNIFIDARPELYMSKLNKTDKSPLVEYSELVAGGEKLFEDGKPRIISPSETIAKTNEFLNKYKFDYILLDKSIELSMNIYLGMSSEWAA